MWVSDCEGDSEQVEAAKGRDSMRRPGHTEQLVNMECEGSSQAGLASSAQGTLKFLSMFSNKPRQMVWGCKNGVADTDVM